MGKTWLGADNGFRAVQWRRGKQVISGEYRYEGYDVFSIMLNGRDKITGMCRTFTVLGDKPEWDGWKLINRR